MRKKIAILLAIALLFLAGCTGKTEPSTAPPTAPAPLNPPRFSAGAFPRLDGSTANIPLAVELAKLCLGFDDLAAEEFITFNATSKAYENLANGACDLLLVYEASEETKEKLGSMGADFEYFAIGKDALVFIVNENNPVQNLAAQQLVDIYAGKVTNWKELGGEDIEIVAFQRNAASGSQALMEKLVMKGAPMAQAPVEFTPGEMSGLVDGLAEYNNTSAAIGYSVFYYASLMYTRPGLRFIGVDGAMPSNETIASGAYPFTNAFYAVLRADEPEGSPARMLAAWLCGSEGQALIERCGYVAG
jgi:phosphate transport system substrate-binding protein